MSSVAASASDGRTATSVAPMSRCSRAYSAPLRCSIASSSFSSAVRGGAIGPVGARLSGWACEGTAPAPRSGAGTLSLGVALVWRGAGGGAATWGRASTYTSSPTTIATTAKIAAFTHQPPSDRTLTVTIHYRVARRGCQSPAAEMPKTRRVMRDFGAGFGAYRGGRQILPSTAGRAAPVAEGTFDAIPRSVE